jgi:uncharacterized protein YegL
MYTQPATTVTPALVIYLIDSSDSMNEPCGETTKITLVNKALRAVLKDMVRRSIRDGHPQSRYKIALFAYNSRVIDVLNGICDLPDLINLGVPEIIASGKTDTAGAYAAAEKLLRENLHDFQRCPAPLVCHLTDGKLTTDDPRPIVARIREMKVDDGQILVENIYVGDRMLRKTVQNWRQWGGVMRENDLTDDYARFLFHLSSPLPETYRENINNFGYALQPGAHLFFPGTHNDLVRLAFAASAATQLK